jgi:L-2,4-diaminobutyrate decarboxylase
MPYEPESNIVCFRYGTGDQGAIRERLMDSGEFYLTSTEIDGERYLRVTVMAPATDEQTLTSLPHDQTTTSGVPGVSPP